MLPHKSVDAPEVMPLALFKPFAEGSSFSAFCAVSKGSRPLQFEWRKNGALIESARNVKIKQIEEDKSMIAISNLNLNNAGNYSCTARNSFGEDSGFVLLNIKGETATSITLN